MKKHTVIIKQVYRVVREIEIEVEVEDYNTREDAVEIAETEGDVPAFDDPRWRSGYDLQNEEFI